MTKENIANYIKEMVTYANNTSYKYYLMLAILSIGKKYDIVSFEECGKELLVQAWNDVSDPGNYYSKTDKLKQIKNEILFKTSALEYMSNDNLRSFLSEHEDTIIKSYYLDTVKVCIYRLLSYGQWNEILSNVQHHYKKNKLIKVMSQNELCLYEIYDNYIVLNSVFFDVINSDSDYYKNIVREELRHYLSRKK